MEKCVTKDIGGKSYFNGKANFANGKKCPDHLTDDFWKMREKAGKEGRSYALVEIQGKAFSVPLGNSENTLASLVKLLNGKFHGIVVCLR